jgi:putative transposase
MEKLSSKEWRVGRTCVFQNHIHLVFVTKYRRDALTNAMLVRLRELFNEICLGLSSQPLEFNGEDDHVHLLVSLHPKISLSVLIGRLKGKSAYFLRREFWPEIKTRLWGEHFWSPSYMAVSCSGAPLAIIKQYIEQQRRPS